MGILDWLFRPSTSGSSGLFNQANQHWRQQQAATSAGDDRKRKQEILEVIRLCQQAILANKNEGNAYVLLTNALVVAIRPAYGNEETRNLLRKYAAGAIYKWWTLPHKQYPVTKPRTYDLGVHFYQEVLKELQRAEGCSQQEAEMKMAAYGTQYGDLAISPQSYERIRQAILGIAETSTSRLEGGAEGGVEVDKQIMATSLEYAAQATERANKACSPLLAIQEKQSPLPETQEIIQGWHTWWFAFLGEYSASMIEWFLQVASAKNVQRAELERLWDTVFDPLWAKTVEVAMNIRLEDVRQGWQSFATAHQLNAEQLVALEQWTGQLNEASKVLGMKLNQEGRKSTRATAMFALDRFRG